MECAARVTEKSQGTNQKIKVGTMLNHKKRENCGKTSVTTSFILLGDLFYKHIININLSVTQGHVYSLCRWFNGGIMSICIIATALTTPYVLAGNVGGCCLLFPTERALESDDKKAT